MYTIDKDFLGGNAEILSIGQNEVKIKRELRDTTQEWFYWAFRVCGAAGKTITFDITNNYIGKFGPCVSHNNNDWHWLGLRNNEHSFTYTFNDDEDCVYFAHNALYNPERFYNFCAKKGFNVKYIAESKKGRKIPFLEFGDGEEYIICVARHHACEATGSFVLEGILDELKKCPIKNKKVLCVPFIDYDGVCDGDQGKSRAPYDHNKDYKELVPPIYETVAFLREFAKSHKIAYAFDLHSPWHEGGDNDNAFIPMKNYCQLSDIKKFSDILEKNTSLHNLRYYTKNNIEPDVGWNSSKADCFSTYMCRVPKSILSFTLETCYFGYKDNMFTPNNAVILGQDFARTISEFDKLRIKETSSFDSL